MTSVLDPLVEDRVERVDFLNYTPDSKMYTNQRSIKDQGPCIIYKSLVNLDLDIFELSDQDTGTSVPNGSGLLLPL